MSIEWPSKEFYMEKLSYRTSIVESFWTSVNYELDSTDRERSIGPESG